MRSVSIAFFVYRVVISLRHEQFSVAGKKRFDEAEIVEDILVYF